jgi:hypothetical protein
LGGISRCENIIKNVSNKGVRTWTALNWLTEYDDKI